MGKHKYSKVVEFLWLRQKSIETLKDRMSKFLDHRKCMGKLKEFLHNRFLNIFVVKHMKSLKCGKNEFQNCRQNMGNHKPFHIIGLFKIFRVRHKFVESIIYAIP